MSDEQTIYISPEDDLTTVRERLEKITSRRVTLVIPANTQLRSHVAWKLLYARSRELGKEVLIVSSDPQVRSVAHAVKFKVAHSLESNAQGRSRPTGRPTRSSTLRSKPAPGPGRSTKGPLRSTNNLPPRQQGAEDEVWYQPTPDKSPPVIPGREVPDHRIEDVADDSISDAVIPARYVPPEKPRTQAFEYRNRIDQASPLSPVRPSDQQEEDQDMLAEDYRRAQDIRMAASSGLIQAEQSAPPATPGLSESVAGPGNAAEARHTQPTQPPPATPMPADPYIDDEEDSQPAPPREQRGRATIEPTDTLEHKARDAAEMPTSILEHEIEYHGDNDDYLPPTPEPGTQSSWNRPELVDEDEEDQAPDLQRRVHGTRARRGRSGYLSPQTQGRRPEEQAGVEDYKTQINPLPAAPDPSTTSAPVSRTGGREPDPVQLPTPMRGGPRSGNLRTAGPRSGDLRATAGPRSGDLRTAGARGNDARAAAGPRSGDLRAAAGPRSGDLRPTSTRGNDARAATGPRSDDLRSRNAAAARPAAQAQRPSVGRSAASAPKPVPVGNQRRRRLNIILIAAIVVVLLALALLAYAGPAARVTLTVAAHNYTQPVELTVSNNNQPGALPARLITQSFQKKGSEPASGSKLVGTARAKGFVCFTNKGDASVEIPTGSVVSASNGVQFATTADGVVLARSTCANDPLTFPIQAVKPGETGNVAAGSITVIPDSSLDAIARYNKVATSSLKLGVSNGEDVKGGGMQPVPSITEKDLANAKTDLSNQLKAEIDSWAQNLSRDGVTGNVTTDAALVNPPAKDTTIDSGTTFPAEVGVKATVLFVGTADLQKAALNQLATGIQKDKNFSGYTIAEDAKPPLVISQMKKQSDANSLKLNFNATAQAIPIVPKDTVQRLVSGKTPSAARQLLLNNIRGVQDARVEVTPAFFPWVSWWPGHIEVTELPGSTSNSPPTHP